MGKIKLNLTSGAIVEKPLISAFNANNASYVILDNEINGSMGLPIILVCKLENNKLTKIVDQNEWQIVKEYLKNIIAGGQINYIKVDDSLLADDIYYTQLTLPVPSFDALKNAYGVSNDTNINAVNTNSQVAIEQPANPAINGENGPISPTISLQPEMPVNNPVNNIVPPEVVLEPQMAVNNDNVVTNSPTENILNVNANTGPVMDSAPVVENVPNSVIDLSTPMPTFDNMNAGNQDVTVETQNQENSIKNLENVSSMFQDQKEAFMQACENMFDALVQKFEKELANKK